MKIKSTFHVFVFLMAVLTLSMPFIALAQEDQWELEARVSAKQDAEANTNQVLWIGGNFLLGLAGGCVLGSVGLLGAHLYEPPVPASRLVGKSPEYISTYADAYKAKARDLQIRSAFIGCLGGSVVSGCVLASYLNDQ
ncbi:MAG: hypothetical protein OXH39_02725 [Candidatus Poribacteria bacterium]|nr:hypothetical protein [Candidatus Poribacteria bacterium]